MNKLEIARIIGECTLGAGVCAGAGCAVVYSREVKWIRDEWTSNVQELESEYLYVKGCISNPDPALIIVNPDCRKRLDGLDALFKEDIPKLKNHPIINVK